ncbi:hypothetical protein C8R46DRAFT_1061290 [Mycena filopes]|nr:hypothetical protein C8R46DRAFT_1061290 [Mycena filopes]
MAIEVDFVDSEFTSDEILDLLSSIVSHRTRLEHLKLRSDGPESLRALSGPMPRLRHLDLFFQYEFRESAVLVFSEAPLLRTVILTYTAKMVALPWAQLTSLTLRYLYPSECSPVLKQTTNLAFCHLLLFDEDDLIPTPVVVLPSLTSLKLEEDPIPDYLHTFNVPSLRCLEITEGFLGPNPVQSLASFISRSGCNLQQLIMCRKPSILRSAYREAFPSISFSFIADGED